MRDPAGWEKIKQLLNGFVSWPTTTHGLQYPIFPNNVAWLYVGWIMQQLTARKFCGFREVQAALAKVTLTITEKGYFGNGLPWGFCADACWNLCLLYNTLSDDNWKHSVQFILILGIFSPVFFLWRCVYIWRNYTKLLAAAIPFSNHFAKLKYNFLATKPLMLASCPYNYP